MGKHFHAPFGAGLLLGVSILAAQAQTVEPTIVPDPPEFSAKGTINFVGATDIYTFGALPEYKEPAWVTENFVSTGKLPPVAERLPREPMVYRTADMKDGPGVYGDTLRHVIGGRPEGWNWIAGQNQGWGGVEYGMWECLTRTGPLFRVRAEEVAPMPNLAKSWEWSEDGHQLTMQLVEGVKWSDGDPFDAEDVMFFWEDHILDTNIAPQGGASREVFGKNTTLEALDPYNIRWTFEEVRPEAVLYEMAFGKFCPLPSHVMKPQHPTYNADNTYEEYKNAFPPEFQNFPGLGAWVPVNYRPDEIIVLRRNPYFWKVDDQGNQLPYLDEVQYKLSTWPDRTIQAVAGSGDWSNMEETQNYVEALKKAADPAAPARLEFGPRILGYSLELNYGIEGWGAPDERQLANRELNRNLDFRKAVTTGLDRVLLGESLVKGPFTAIYPGGLYPDTTFYDQASTVYYPYSIEQAKAYLAAAGLSDTDGDGFVNYPDGKVGGQNVEIALMAGNASGTDTTQSEAIIAMMERIGLKILADYTDGNGAEARRDAGNFDWAIRRVEREFNTVLQDLSALGPVGPQTSPFHRAGPDGKLDLLPFEQELVDILSAFRPASPEERKELMKRYQKIFTENVYSVGLSNYPGALIINKRLRNVASGTPILSFQWAEDSAMREQMYVPEAEQQDYELFPNTLAGL
jgi:peptide/nickel transport system substrate-binding protein